MIIAIKKTIGKNFIFITILPPLLTNIMTTQEDLAPPTNNNRSLIKIIREYIKAMTMITLENQEMKADPLTLPRIEQVIIIIIAIIPEIHLHLLRLIDFITVIIAKMMMNNTKTEFLILREELKVTLRWVQNKREKALKIRKVKVRRVKKKQRKKMIKIMIMRANMMKRLIKRGVIESLNKVDRGNKEEIRIDITIIIEIIIIESIVVEINIHKSAEDNHLIEEPQEIPHILIKTVEHLPRDEDHQEIDITEKDPDNMKGEAEMTTTLLRKEADPFPEESQQFQNKLKIMVRVNIGT